MDDLVAFLRARLDEDERVARAAGGDQWPDSAHEMWDNPLAHARRHDPARVLREVEAKRRIVELHPHRRFATLPEEWPEHWRAEIKPAFPGTEQPYVGCERCDFNGDYEVFEPDWWCEHVRLLALPHSDHPDYRAEWAVTP